MQSVALPDIASHRNTDVNVNLSASDIYLSLQESESDDETDGDSEDEQDSLDTDSHGFPLPGELYRQIFKCLSIDDLPPLISTSKAIREEAGPLFYEHIAIDGVWPSSVEGFATISKHVGHWVKSLKIMRIPSSNEDVLLILESTPNLSSLEMTWTNNTLVYPHFTRFVPSDPPFKLQTLKLEYGFCPLLVAFLDNQRLSLNRLELCIDVYDPPPIEIDFPHLHSLITTCASLSTRLLIQGSIKCLGGPVIFRAEYKDPAPSIQVIKELNLDWKPDWSQLAWRFPNIRFLQAYTSLPGQDFLNTLPPFRYLERIQVEFKGRRYIDDCAAAVETCFDRNKKLQVVDIFQSKGYRTFRRGENEVVYDSEVPEEKWEEWTKYIV